MTESKRQKTIGAAFAVVLQQGATAGRPVLASAAKDSVFPREASLGLTYVDLTTWSLETLVESLERRLLLSYCPPPAEGNQWFVELLGALWGASLRASMPPKTISEVARVLREWDAGFRLSAPAATEALPDQLAREAHAREWGWARNAAAATVDAFGKGPPSEMTVLLEPKELGRDAEEGEARLFRSLFERRLKRPPPPAHSEAWRALGRQAFQLAAERSQWTLLRDLADAGTLPIDDYDIGLRLSVAMSLAGRRQDARTALITALQRWIPLYWGPNLPPAVLTLRVFRDLLNETEIASIARSGRGRSTA